LPRLCLPGHGPTRGLWRGEGAAPGGGSSRRRSPLRLGPAGSLNRQARLNPTRRPSMSCQGGLGRPSVGLSGPCVSSHRTRVRKASQRFVSLKAFSTDETNQRFRQRRAKVPSSNQWIIAQPTSCLLRLPALSGVLSGANVRIRLSARETQCGVRERVGSALAASSSADLSPNQPHRSLPADPEELPDPRRPLPRPVPKSDRSRLQNRRRFRGNGSRTSLKICLMCEDREARRSGAMLAG
jgi:hypothetical protein